MTPRRAERPRVATSSPLGTSGSYIAAPSSPPNSARDPKTTTRSEEPPTSCLRSCLVRTTSNSLQREEPARRLTEKLLRPVKEREGNYHRGGNRDVATDETEGGRETLS